MKTVEVIGVHARARCYNGAAALEVATVDVTDPLGLEAAFDSSFSIPRTSKPTATAGDDPLGLEEAFDVAFGDPAAGVEDQSDSTEPDASASSDDADSRAGLAPGTDDEENLSDISENGDGDDGEGGPLFTPEDRRHVRKLRRAGFARRDRLNLKWHGRIIGNLTMWGNNISCVCRVHAQCRSPAARDWPSDSVLEDWILSAIKEDGNERMDREAHIASIRAVQQRLRARNRS